MSKIEISKIVKAGESIHKIKSKVINQVSLTSDCWMVQFWGLSACKNCEYKGTEDCGGKKILAKIKAGKYPNTGLPDVSYPKGG